MIGKWPPILKGLLTAQLISPARQQRSANPGSKCGTEEVKSLPAGPGFFIANLKCECSSGVRDLGSQAA